jgi:hypothetical protein
LAKGASGSPRPGRHYGGKIKSFVLFIDGAYFILYLSSVDGNVSPTKCGYKLTREGLLSLKMAWLAYHAHA